MLLRKNISSTKSTPEFILDPEGIIRIKGRSMNENVLDYSKQLDEWIDKYICNPADLTCVDFFLEYLSTSNCKYFISLLQKIESIKLMDKKFLISWFYEEGDEDIFEKGEYISSILDVPFNFVMISD